MLGETCERDLRIRDGLLTIPLGESVSARLSTLRLAVAIASRTELVAEITAASIAPGLCPVTSNYLLQTSKIPAQSGRVVVSQARIF